MRKVDWKLVNTFALTFYMIIKWNKSRGIQIMTIFKFSNFTAVFSESKGHLSNRIDSEYIFQIQTSNSLSISVQSFLRMNKDSWVNSTTLTLLALNTRISYEWLFQNLQTKYKYVRNSVGWNLSDERNVREHLFFINPSNSAF